MNDFDLYPMDAVSDFGTDSVSSRPFAGEVEAPDDTQEVAELV